MGRPPKLTPELRVDVERQLADGVPIAVVAQRFGIGPRTLTRWIGEGRVVRRRLAPTPDPAPTLSAFGDQFDRAEPGLVGIVVAAAQRGSWQAAAWVLERRWPERWARPGQRQVDDGPRPAGDDPFVEVDQLAERSTPAARPRAYDAGEGPLGAALSYPIGAGTGQNVTCPSSAAHR